MFIKVVNFEVAICFQSSMSSFQDVAFFNAATSSLCLTVRLDKMEVATEIYILMEKKSISVYSFMWTAKEQFSMGTCT